MEALGRQFHIKYTQVTKYHFSTHTVCPAKLMGRHNKESLFAYKPKNVLKVLRHLSLQFYKCFE